MILLAVVEQIRCGRMRRHRTEAKGKTMNRSASCQPLPVLLYLARRWARAHVAQSETILEEWQREWVWNVPQYYSNVVTMTVRGKV